MELCSFAKIVSNNSQHKTVYAFTFRWILQLMNWSVYGRNKEIIASFLLRRISPRKNGTQKRQHSQIHSHRHTFTFTRILAQRNSNESNDHVCVSLSCTFFLCSQSVREFLGHLAIPFSCVLWWNFLQHILETILRQSVGVVVAVEI